MSHTLSHLFSQYVLLFMIFSILGWIMEVVLKCIEFHRFINRGFLIGPYCPIYGAGAVLVTMMVNLFAREEAGFVDAFFISFVFCGALEYFASWFLEKVYNARWWDYSHRPMNLEGRVWIGNLVLFGFGGDIISLFFAPAIFSAADRMNPTLLHVICIAFLGILAADVLTSHFVTNAVRTAGNKMPGDNTEEITKEIRRFLHEKSLLHRRLLDAFPAMQIRNKAITRRLRHDRQLLAQKVKEERKRLYDRYIN